MTNKVVDSFVMNLVVQVDKKSSQKTEKNIEKSISKSVEKGTEEGISKGAKKSKKGTTSSIESAFKNVKGAILGGVVAGAIIKAFQIAIARTKESLTAVETQLDVADKIATVAAQTGIDLKDFIKLQKILEFGDVDAESAQASIVEFQKRLGDFQKTGAQKEFFEGIGIGKNTSSAEAFLRAISAAQNVSGAERQSLADKLFGGFGTAQLAEFLTGQLSDQVQSIAGIDFDRLASQVALGSSEQSKITQAKVQSGIDKLSQTTLSADTNVLHIQRQTLRDISLAQEANNKRMVQYSEQTADAMETGAKWATVLANAVVEAGKNLTTRFYSNVKSDLGISD